MTHIFFILLCLLLGILLRKTGRLPEHAPSALNGFIIHFSLPALTFLHIHELTLNMVYLYAMLMPWVFFLIGSVFFISIGRWQNIPPKTVGCLILTCALGNTSFVGLPMIEAFFGKQHIGTGLVVDQAGTFLVLSTLGILTATRYATGQVPFQAIIRRIFMFPPFYAFIGAVLLKPVVLPDWLIFFLERFSVTLIPLALVSVGLQIRFHTIGTHSKHLAIGLLYKMMIGPALMLLFFVGILGGKGEILQVTIFEAAMPPIIMGSVVAIEHKLDPPLATLLLGIGIPLSVLTLMGWYAVIQFMIP